MEEPRMGLSYVSLYMVRKPWMANLMTRVDRAWDRTTILRNKIYIPTRPQSGRDLNGNPMGRKGWSVASTRYAPLLFKRKYWKIANTWSNGHYR